MPRASTGTGVLSVGSIVISGGTISVTQGTSPWVISGDINLSEVGGQAVGLGQAVMASSIPVVIATDQSTINTALPTGTTIHDSSSHTLEFVHPGDSYPAGGYGIIVYGGDGGNNYTPYIDSSGIQRHFLWDAAGNGRGAYVTSANELLVNVNNALTISGTVAVTQSTSPWGIKPIGGTPTLADGNTNQPTTFQALSGNDIYQPTYPFLFNGTTWDRIRGDTTNGLDVDVTRVIPGTGATNLGKAVDNAAGATDTGVADLAIRDDVLTTLTPVDGDYTNLRTGPYGDTWVSLATALSSTIDSVTADTELPAAATIAADGVTPTVPGIAAYGFVKTPGANTWDRHYSAVNATNSTGTGIAAAGILAQFDDTSPTAITENQFGNLRMSANRNQYVTIRDAAGNERGVNVDANNNLGIVLPAETTKVIGSVRNLGNVGAIFDGVNTAATAPANGLLGLGIYNSSEPGPTTGQSVGIQLDSKGRQKMTIMDAAGNNRGANVDSGGHMAVAISDGSGTSITSSGQAMDTSIKYINGNAIANDNGASSNGTIRVTVANNSTGVISTNVPTGTSLNTYAARITSNTTTTPTSSTAYISSITLVTEVAGTGSTIVIRDKQGTPQVLVNGLVTTALTTTPSTINFQTPNKMTSGIDIVTAGVGAATVDVWINYYA